MTLNCERRRILCLVVGTSYGVTGLCQIKNGCFVCNILRNSNSFLKANKQFNDHNNDGGCGGGDPHTHTHTHTHTHITDIKDLRFFLGADSNVASQEITCFSES